MKSVYVYFHPVSVEVPDTVHAALTLDGRDRQNAESICATIAEQKLSDVFWSRVDEQREAYVEKVIKA